MRHYADFFIWENQYCLRQLNKYFDLFRQYCESFETDDKATLLEIKSMMGRKRLIIEKIFYKAGKHELLKWASEEGLDFNIIEELPQLVTKNQSYIIFDRLLDIISVYESNVNKSLFNTINPFHWVATIFQNINEFILSPFYYLLATKELDKDTLGWRLARVILVLLEVFAVLLISYTFQHDFKSFVDNIKSTVL